MCAYLTLFIINPLTLFHFLTFSFHLPFILVIIHWHSCHSMRMRMRIRIVALLASLDLGQKLCKNLFARLPGNNNNNNNNANKNNNNARGCLAALTNATCADLQQFSILMCIIKYLRNIIHSLLLPAELKLIP